MWRIVNLVDWRFLIQFLSRLVVTLKGLGILALNFLAFRIVIGQDFGLIELLNLFVECLFVSFGDAFVGNSSIGILTSIELGY